MKLKVFLAGMDSAAMRIDDLINKIPDGYIKYGLASYYYLKDEAHMNQILKKVQFLLIDSGAFTMQRGKNADFERYTIEYVQFIRKYKNNPQIIGFFEMDIDVIVGYDKVLKMRAMLEKETDKIIPVWHHNRGIKEYNEMCKKYSGRRVSISCIGNRDVRESQYNLFINTAHKYNCHIHMLGMTRFSLIKELNLDIEDSVDSSSWLQQGIYSIFSLPKENFEVVSYDSFQRLEKAAGPSLTINLHTFREIANAFDLFDNSIYGNKGG